MNVFSSTSEHVTKLLSDKAAPVYLILLLFITGISLSFLTILTFSSNVTPQHLLSVYFLMTTSVILVTNNVLGRTGVQASLISSAVSVSIICLLYLKKGLFGNGFEKLISTSQMAVYVLIIHIIMSVYALYLLENVYRYALTYQRRIGRLIFLGLLCIILFQAVISTKWLLYGWIPHTWLSSFGLLNALFLGLIMLGILKYRIIEERVKVTRGAVYSSFSLLIAGAFFTAAGISMLALQALGFQASRFDIQILLVSSVLTAIVVSGSARMRRRLKKFLNRRLFEAKYDYRSQFFELHRMSFQSEEGISVFEEILEHLRLTMAAEHAYLFLTDEKECDYVLLSPKERNLPASLTISAQSSLVKELKQKGEYFGTLQSKSLQDSQESQLHTLHITDVAPIFHSGRLLAFLGIRRDGAKPIDTEDTALIEVYCTTIADLLFKRQLQKTMLEQKQFESFSHMASFIAHDVKNQVSTLKLLLRNAEVNISNPEFQKSLLISLKHCTRNLDSLIQKLQQPPQKDRLRISNIQLGPILLRIINETGLKTDSALKLYTQIDETASTMADQEAVYYSAKNLIMNALEALKEQDGMISIRVQKAENAEEWLQHKMLLGKHLLHKHSAIIAVEDNGCGMDENFVKNKLFQPFSTTKDKGVGIGLYQCKTLIEQMGGKIVCHSELAKGSVFCIIL